MGKRAGDGSEGSERCISKSKLCAQLCPAVMTTMVVHRRITTTIVTAATAPHGVYFSDG